VTCPSRFFYPLCLCPMFPRFCQNERVLFSVQPPFQHFFPLPFYDSLPDFLDHFLQGGRFFSNYVTGGLIDANSSGCAEWKSLPYSSSACFPFPPSLIQITPLMNCRVRGSTSYPQFPAGSCRSRNRLQPLDYLEIPFLPPPPLNFPKTF